MWATITNVVNGGSHNLYAKLKPTGMDYNRKNPKFHIINGTDQGSKQSTYSFSDGAPSVQEPGIIIPSKDDVKRVSACA